MHAIRCREFGRSFRRDGVVFSGDAWTFVGEATEAQLGEPMLLAVEVEGEDDPRLQEHPFPGHAVIAEPEESEESQANDQAAEVSYIARLEAANAECRTEIERLEGVNAQWRDASGDLVSQIERLEAVNKELRAEIAALNTKAPAVDDVDEVDHVVHVDGAEQAPADVATAPVEAAAAEPVSHPARRAHRARGGK